MDGAVGSLGDFLDDLNHQQARAGVSHQDSDDGSDRPFLSVVMRTQGRRPQPLRDALLCLQAQTLPDFEVVLAAHCDGDEARADVASAVGDLPSDLARRVRVLDVAAGGRARPLNEGFATARGRYVAVLDDDDLVLGHWVETFAQVAAQAPGTVARTVCVEQNVAGEDWAGGRHGACAAGPIVHRYPTEFDLVEHLSHNRTPFLAYAFPREVFHRLGLRFDESLDICEDWDFELRAALLVGVTSTDTVTCIYRRWVGGDSSYTRHSADEWRTAERAIIERLDARPHLVPAGTVSRLRQVAHRRTTSTHDPPGTDDLLATIDRLEATVAEYETSRSWRITRPLRAATAVTGRWRRG